MTRLSFPVHVLARTETYDAVRKVRFVSTYKYHHGYYDAPEREFRGFGLVEQFDAESFSADRGKGLFADAPPADEEFHIPPVLTKTWFHTGAFLDKARITKQFAKEYYAGDAAASELPDGFVPSGLSVKDIREACRALKGQMLRQEVYALDGSALEAHPYKVTEVCPAILPVQPSKPNRYGSFFAYVHESVDVHYERNASDPRVVHTLALAVDPYGQVTKSASIAYARRNIPVSPADLPQGLLATVTETVIKNEPAQADWYRIGMPIETRTYELTGLPTTQSTLLSFAAVEAAVNAATVISYEVAPTANTLQKRLVEHVKQRYYDSLTVGGPNPTALPFGEIDALSLPYETYALVFTPGLLADAFAGRTPPIPLATITALVTSNEAGYIEENGLYWLPTGREIFDPAKFYLAVEVRDVFGTPTTITYDTHCLLVNAVEDALGNIVTVENDYRVLGPVLVTDPNGNRSAVKVDELGMVIATAVMGKVGGSDGDTLEDPTTTFEYDLDRWQNDGKPNMVHSAVREEHGDEGSPWQHSYTYLDGLGGELMKKVQAEPGLAPVRDEITGELEKDLEGNLVLENASPRWVGTGRVVLDNKGNPIKQYEPFFSSTHEYEDEDDLVQWGVTPILRYDPLGRLIRTEMPDGSVSRVELTSWKQSTWDGNDTVLDAGNAWHAARQSTATPTPSAQDQRAATLTQAHAGTPGIVHFDTLGRPAIGIENNGPGAEYATTAELDIEGNPVQTVDARGNVAAQNKFDLLGRTLYTKSCDAGERWTLMNAVGNPIRGWDSRRHIVTSVYDVLHRRTELWVLEEPDPQEPPPPEPPPEKLAEQTIYGESQPNPEVANLRGKVYRIKDGAGAVTNVEYDFKGNLLEAHRQLAAAFSGQLDWSQAVPLEAETFVQETTYDALNRPTSMKTPDQSIVTPTYNEAGLLERVEAKIRGAQNATVFVDDIDYDAKGQRERIAYGDVTQGAGVVTEYEYDELTFRVKRIKTTRTSDSVILQDLRYFYDAVGNIVEMADLAQNSFYHNGELIEPIWKYEYDAIYRLISATGREHAGQNASVDHDVYGFSLVNAPNPNDPQAMRNYTETYSYDAVGNFVEMVHATLNSAANWTRQYTTATSSNRLQAMSLSGAGADPYSDTYDPDDHGNMRHMSHLPTMEWDFKDQLAHVVKSGAGDVYFTYDASGQRVRKVWVHNGITEERIYLGGFELYRRHENGLVLERETLHIMDDTRRIAMVETKTIDADVPNLTVVSRTRFQCSNHLGSATLEVDENGLVISYEEYHPYGTSAYRAVNGSIEVSAKRYRYTGKERDEETGLYYHGARYYACWLGRWTSADPAGMVDGVNLYRYGRDNPVYFMDPSGTEVKTTYLGSSKEEKYVSRLEKTWGGNQYWAESGSNGAGWYVQTEGNRIVPIRMGSEPIRIGVTTVEHIRGIRGHETPDGAPRPKSPLFMVEGQIWDARDFRPSSDVGIVEAVKSAWKQGDTADRAELVATGVGAAGAPIPYGGDYVSLGASAFIFGAKPSWSAAEDVGLDAAGAILPFVPALGTLRRAEAIADAARDTAHQIDAVGAGYRGLQPGDR
ncbi:MAG: toxin, partial [Polyangiaceae bacterium]|nr:toxin [Polyangiaceae bacterium]